ncbi:MAG: hypothetical protein JW829_07340 [Pirellulales bacterium]|nr:hypothetical protein [Pirellulales bacterium]
MAASPFADVGGVDVFADHLCQAVRRESFAKMRQEQCVVIRINDQTGPNFGDVLVDPRQRPGADRDLPVLLALALTDHQRTAIDVHVVQLQVDHFHPPDLRRVERFQDGPVAQTERIGQLWDGQDRFRSADRQDVFWEQKINQLPPSQQKVLLQTIDNFLRGARR